MHTTIRIVFPLKVKRVQVHKYRDDIVTSKNTAVGSGKSSLITGSGGTGGVASAVMRTTHRTLSTTMASLSRTMGVRLKKSKTHRLVWS
jgi:tetrahydromethanopterin S-methyltransferase subunit D